ncbi:SigE family RNA polymerase sigma factor [Dactylosporangium sucinum]|uniref:DNA-directed RNA polymerase sigma-70 factor n=1 Tax=Dactylosporangium sucinum TaxID=1424081 RepID=A0A917WGS6_9ACTN|nr:SigE family RNA polymerase sigma factor [Dactylosporangium sucinum]GGM05522.1 DNA-directed RNA polymerase sigma-70 factor [Dactylosporangium sucinum]
MGSKTLFEEYVRARAAGLARVAFLLTGDAHLAEDLVQVTLIEVASRWERILAGGDPEPYVRTVLYRKHLSWWRRHRRDARPTGELPEPAVPDIAGEVTTTVAVRRALDTLAPKQRAVLVLRYFEDLTESQAATVLGVRVGTVRSQTRDALARLRRLAPELSDLAKAVDR